MKKVLSAILALIMLVSLSAVSAFAVVTDASVEAADSSDLQIWDDIGYITGVTPKTSQEDFLAQLVPSNCELTLDCSSTYVGTGTVVNLVSDDSTVIKSYTIVLYGDLDCNGEVDSYDKISFLGNNKNTNYEYILDKVDGYLKSDLPAEVWAAADSNHDGIINKLDRQTLDSYTDGKAEIDQTAKPGFDAEVHIYRNDLEAMLKKFEAIDLSIYSTAGVKYAIWKYNQVIETYNNPDATQTDINNAAGYIEWQIDSVKKVRKEQKPLQGVLAKYINITDEIGDNSYFVWDKNNGILTLCPGPSGEIDVPKSTVWDVGGRPVPWEHSAHVTTIVITAPINFSDNFIHDLPNLRSIVITDPDVYMTESECKTFLRRCCNLDDYYGITVYGCSDKNKSLADARGFEYKSLDEYSVSTENGSDILIDSADKTITGVSAGKSAADFLVYDVGVGGNCYVELDSDVVGTGAKLLVKSVIDGSTIDEYDIVLYGDVDGDGLYDATDAYKVNLIINGWLTREQVGEAAWAAADCNHDGVIDSLDAELLERAGLLLSQIDQSKPQSEIVTSDEYIEYQSLIDQSPEPQESEPDITPEPEPTVFEQIISFIKQAIEFVINFFKGLIK